MIDFGSKVNAMTPVHVAMIGLAIRSTIVSAQKINDFPLKIYEIVFTRFLVQDKQGRDRFF